MNNDQTDNTNKKIDIGWVEVSAKVYRSNIYELEARNILAKKFNLELVLFQSRYFKNRYFKFLESLYYLSKLSGKKDIWILGPHAVILLNKKKTQGKNLALVYHIDSLRSPLVFLINKLFYWRLKEVDAVVTMSEYWKNHFLDKGYKNVYKIYCGFDIKEFDITEEEVLEFKKNYGLEGKPIIYLGNCHKVKGVVDSYKALEGLNAYLVTSSRRQADVPTLNFDLNRKDYLILLKASSVVITMSKFKEGWSITTHEAMLCKTPVIGSGEGGMRELLEGGKQIVCKNIIELRKKVEYLLAHPEIREKMGEDGYVFAKEFTLEKFEKNWLNLIKK